MTLAFGDYLAVAGITVLGGWLAAFLHGYLSRKGENLATHEDIQRLVEQVKATTAATEAIRTEMSGKLWETQERWKAKRRLYIDLIESLRDAAAGWNGMLEAQAKFQAGALTKPSVTSGWKNGEVRSTLREPSFTVALHWQMSSMQFWPTWSMGCGVTLMRQTRGVDQSSCGRRLRSAGAC